MSNEKVVNTRVSKDLYDKISKKAKNHRVSVSNLIRNLVEDALEVHEDFHEVVDRKIKSYLNEEEVEEKILGFQKLELSVNTVCTNCNKSMSVGEFAFLPFYEGNVVPRTRELMCLDCKEAKEKNIAKE